MRTTLTGALDGDRLLVTVPKDVLERRFTIPPTPNAHRIVLRVNAPGVDIEVVYPRVQGAFSCLIDDSSVDIERLRLRPEPTPSSNGTFVIVQGSHVNVLSVEDTTLRLQLASPCRELRAERVVVDSGDVIIKRLVASGEVRFQAAPTIECAVGRGDHVFCGDGNPNLLSVEGNIVVAGTLGVHATNVGLDLRDDCRLRLSGSNIVVRGTGAIDISGTVDGLTTATGISVRIHPGGSIVMASGEADTLHCQSGVFSAAPDHPFVVAHVVEAQGATIDGIDLLALHGSDIAELHNARRFSPAVPGRKAVAKAVKSAPDPRSAVRFWSRMSHLLAEQDCDGSAQSRVREGADRARLRVAGSSEKALLTIGLILGFGERIVRPIVVWAAVALAAATSLEWGFGWDTPPGGHQGFAKACVYVAAAPLELLRVHVDRPNARGMWDTAIYQLAKAVGTVCIGAALLAGKRLFRPPHS